MAINDVFRLTVVLKQTGTDNQIINNFCFRQMAVTIFDTPEEDLVQAFRGEAETEYLTATNQAFELEKYQVTPLPLNELSYEYAPLTTKVGTDNGNLMPPSTAGLISWKTAKAGRSGKGRTFLPPPGDGKNDDGIPTTAYRNTVASAFANALIGMASASPLVYASYELGIWSTKLQEFNPVTSFIVRPYWANVRSRRF